MLKGWMYHFNGKIKLVKQGDNISVGGAVNLQGLQARMITALFQSDYAVLKLNECGHNLKKSRGVLFNSVDVNQQRQYRVDVSYFSGINSVLHYLHPSFKSSLRIWYEQLNEL